MTRIHCNNCDKDFYIISGIEYVCTHCPHCGCHHMDQSIYGNFDKPYMFPNCPHYEELKLKLDAIRILNIFTPVEFDRIKMTLEVTIQNPNEGLGLAYDHKDPVEICFKMGCLRAKQIVKAKGKEKLEIRKGCVKCLRLTNEFIENLSPHDIVKLY